MQSLILDSNSFLRFLLNDIPKQANEVSVLFAKAKKEELNIFIPQIVIFEIEFALEKYYKFPKEEIVDKLKAIISTPYLEIQDVSIFQEAVISFNNKNLDFVDCFLLCFAQSKKATLFTFDKGLQKLLTKQK